MPGEYAPSWLAAEKASGGRLVLKGTVAEMRAQNDALVAAVMPFAPPFSENVDWVEKTVDGVKVRIYTPRGHSGGLPIAIWMHPGGYMLGDLNADHLTCGLVSEHTNSVVLNVDYRLSPETKWPGQLDDCVKVYKWAHANAASIGGDNTKMFSMGGSAGGGLSFQVANQIVADPALKPSLRGIMAMVPLTAHYESLPGKYKSKYKAFEENAEGVPIIDKESMDIFFREVGADPKDPSMFTILSDRIKDFPPTYMTSCEFDPLRDDAYIMEDALKEVGVPVKHDHYAGFPHYFWLTPGLPEGQTYMANMLAGIGWLQSQM